jgi:microcystin-dependent protein
MSAYVKATNFATKDTLPTGDANKIVKGTEIDNEFNAIAGAISSKADLASPAFTGSPTVPTATAGSNTTQAANTAYVRGEITSYLPSGCIVLWSGAISAIPSGWVLCNGSNSTPDLRNRFVVGAGSTYSVGGTGGSADATLVSHSHSASSSSSVSDPGHSHVVASSPGTGGGAAGDGVQQKFGTMVSSTSATNISVSTSTSISTVGSSATNANLPPYYALAYIMKS